MHSKLRVGQVWDWLNRQTCLPLKMMVVATLPSGCVVLRPLDLQEAESNFPRQEVVLKGKTSWEHPGPFYWVDEEYARKNQESLTKLEAQRKNLKEPFKICALETQLADMYPYQAGDLLAHEAWSVWADMDISTGVSTT